MHDCEVVSMHVSMRDRSSHTLIISFQVGWPAAGATALAVVAFFLGAGIAFFSVALGLGSAASVLVRVVRLGAGLSMVAAGFDTGLAAALEAGLAVGFEVGFAAALDAALDVGLVVAFEVGLMAALEAGFLGDAVRLFGTSGVNERPVAAEMSGAGEEAES